MLCGGLGWFAVFRRCEGLQQVTRVTLYKINFQMCLFLVAGLQGLQ